MTGSWPRETRRNCLKILPKLSKPAVTGVAFTGESRDTSPRVRVSRMFLLLYLGEFYLGSVVV